MRFRRKVVPLAWLAAGWMAAAGAAYVPDEPLFADGFDDEAKLDGWGPDARAHWRAGEGEGGSGALCFAVRGGEAGTDWVSTALPPERFQGRLVVFEARVRGRGVRADGKPWFGAKCMLSYEAGGETQYREPDNPVGDFGWTTRAKMERLPAKLDKLTLHIGLQDGFGEYWVDAVAVRAVRVVDDADVRPPPAAETAAAMPRGDGRGARYRGVMSGQDVSEEAFAQLAAWGANLMRVQMYHYGKFKDRAAYFAWVDAEIERIRTLLPRGERHGVKFVVDLHTGPGHIERADGDPPVDPAILDETWRRIAAAFRGDPRLYGYDLLNEPSPYPHEQAGGDPATPWPEVARRLARVVRAVDRTTPVIVAPWLGHDELYGTEPLDDDHVIYTIHCYRPLDFTHQGIFAFANIRYAYPGYINGLWVDKERLREGLRSAVEFQRRTGKPIFVGEFSAPNWAVGADRWIRDMTELFEEYGWDWTFHAYREWPGWSVEHIGEDAATFHPSSDNPRRRALLAAFARPRPVSPGVSAAPADRPAAGK